MAWTKSSDVATTRRSPEDTGRRVAALEREVASLRAALERAGARMTPGKENTGEPGSLPAENGGSAREPGGDRVTGNPASLGALTDDTVDRAAQRVIDKLERHKNKRPDIDLFASELKLTLEQRNKTEEIVADGQHRIHAVLRVPMADGTVLMDEFVEAFAKGMAQPGRDHGVGKLLQRVGSEKIPGTEETFAARIESIKGEMREQFRKAWSKKQYRMYEQWQLDPSEIQNVKNTPNDEAFRRIRERARELGADVPEPK